MIWLRGLGFDYQDLLNQQNIPQCGPLDDACIAQRDATVEATRNLWFSQYQQDPNTANAPVPTITVNPNVGAVLANPTADMSSFATVTANGQTYTGAQLLNQANLNPTVNYSAFVANADKAAGTPAAAPKATTQTAAGSAAPSLLTALTPPAIQQISSPAFTVPGTDITVPSLPWWALALAAGGVVYFVSRGKR